MEQVTHKVLTQESNEINSQFNMRIKVFDTAVQDGTDEDRAVLLASVFRSCFFLGAGYNDSVVQESQKYWNNDWITHYETIRAT